MTLTLFCNDSIITSKKTNYIYKEGSLRMKDKKRAVIQIRVDQEIKDKFNIYCDNIGTTMSDELKRFIVSRVKKS